MNWELKITGEQAHQLFATVDIMRENYEAANRPAPPGTEDQKQKITHLVSVINAYGVCAARLNEMCERQTVNLGDGRQVIDPQDWTVITTLAEMLFTGNVGVVITDEDGNQEYVEPRPKNDEPAEDDDERD